MTYDQALVIVKNAMRTGTHVAVRFLNPDDGYEVQLVEGGHDRSTASFELAIAWLPQGAKVGR